MLLSERLRRCCCSLSGARLRRAFRRGAGGRLRGRLARLLDLELILEHRLGQRRRRRKPGHFQQHAVGAAQLGLHETARIGGGIDEIARCAAARAKPEAIERDQGGLRIAGHRVSPETDWAYASLRRACDLPSRIITPPRMNPELKAGHKAARFMTNRSENPGFETPRLRRLRHGILLQPLGPLLVFRRILPPADAVGRRRLPVPGLSAQDGGAGWREIRAGPSPPGPQTAADCRRHP